MSKSILSIVSESLHASEAGVRLLISISLGLPIALLHKYTLYQKSPIHQHVFFIVCGILICIWNYGINTFHSITAVLVTYGILKCFGGTTLSVFLTFVINMTYLMCGYYVTSTSDYDIKWTMPQCVLTLRLIGLAFNILDGQQPLEKLSASHKQVMLKKKPTFLEILAFSYFPGSFLVGPQFSMKRYLDYVQGQYIKDNTNVKFSGNRVAASSDSLVPGVSRMLIGFVYLAIYQLTILYIPDRYMLSREFQQHNLLVRLLLIGVWGHFNLYKYIACWLLAEGVCTVFGLTYNGKDEKGQPLWNGCENVKLRQFETATKFNDYIMSFNINTNTWSAEYIYKRLKFLGSKLYSQFFTLLFLATWHGFHSGYYACFFLEFIIMYMEKDITQILEKHKKLLKLLENHPLLQFLCRTFLKIYTFTFMGYSLIPFILLSYPRYHQLYSSVYYCGHMIYLSYPFVSILLKKFLFKKNTSRSSNSNATTNIKEE
ncbi:lysophosphatidylcholine acyltransferase 3 protein nessy [Xylocopa sonorina]|uniref:lysophosphatidylcholine acyltransferase 3 protein nessy n=1 Tax=Xylocopa sonorina TaxID=1818115 RepID=UPI00403B3855